MFRLQLAGHLQVRLQMVQNWQPKEHKESSSMDSLMLLSWLRKLQFKLGQIEVQSSAATQFYTVWACVIQTDQIYLDTDS